MPSPELMNALIGHSGFVGTSLKRQATFDALFRSTDMALIDGREFDTVVCAGAPAQKWVANNDPAADWRALADLIAHLCTIRCRHFILVSTVDVYGIPFGVDESVDPREKNLQPYGLHRLRLERFVRDRFPSHLVLRLPGLVGPGLRKNVVYDFHNDNNLHAVDSRSVFQFYPVVNLWPDIQDALRAQLTVAHLTAEPVSVARVAEQGFNRSFRNELAAPPANYDLQTMHADVFGANGRYQYAGRDSMLAIRAYAQSEPLAARRSS
jgi:dTDP-4-dehydrorhamnose reductase